MRRFTATLLFLGLFAGVNARAQDATGAKGEARSADGVAIRYEVRGMGEPALVLVHGWTNSREIWGKHPRTLARTHRTIALDLAGHGESGADRTTWTMDAFGEDVAAVVKHLELERVVLVGFSMGGAAVLEAAERLPGRVVGIVLVDAIHDPDVTPPPEMAAQMEAQMRAKWGDTTFLRAFGFTPDAPDSLVQAVADMSPARPHEHWFPILHEAFRWSNGDAKETFERISVPVAAINTTRIPTNVDAFRRYAPSFTVDTLSGVGHAGILLQRVEDFDARLLAIVERFQKAERRE